MVDINDEEEEEEEEEHERRKQVMVMVMVHTRREGHLVQQGCDRYGRPADEHGSASLFPSLQPNQHNHKTHKIK